jgi:hypothetical protein
MSPSAVALVLPACVLIGALARYFREMMVLRQLKRLLEGCDPQQRAEVCLILAKSLHAGQQTGVRREL